VLLALALVDSFKAFGDLADLSKAIDMLQSVVAVTVRCQKSVTCLDLDIHVRRSPAMKIKTTHSSPTVNDMTVFSQRARGQ
jgi:hypothetical protein